MARDNEDIDDDNDGYTEWISRQKRIHWQVQVFHRKVSNRDSWHHVGLGAWDLIGIFGGAFVLLIMFGFLTVRQMVDMNDVENVVQDKNFNKLHWKWETMMLK